MTPGDIVKVLTAVAPIAASVASLAKSENQNIERKETPQTNTVSITINNYFNTTTSQKDAFEIADKMQNQLIGSITSDSNRYTL